MQIQKILHNLEKKFQSHLFSEIKFNSKECKKNDIFFAIKGTKIDGNKFITNAIKNGAKTIISDLKFQGYKDNVLFLNSKNPRKTLAEVSSAYYKKNLRILLQSQAQMEKLQSQISFFK